MEFDLSSVIFKSDSKIRWILNRPRREEKRQNLKELEYTYEKQDEDDILAIHKQMALINGTANRTNKGYKYCIDDDIKAVQDKFKALIDYTIRADQARDIIKGDDDAVDIEAIEGQIREGKYLSRKRNSAIVAKRKEIDGHKCQACNFRLEIKGKYVIECHHLFPLRGEIITRVEDLSCLCPTCHRIAHKRKTPFSIDEIRRILKKPE
jgi:5-methylcytosine-specific restriction protein A